LFWEKYSWFFVSSAENQVSHQGYRTTEPKFFDGISATFDRIKCFGLFSNFSSTIHWKAPATNIALLLWPVRPFGWTKTLLCRVWIEIYWKYFTKHLLADPLNHFPFNFQFLFVAERINNILFWIENRLVIDLHFSTSSVGIVINFYKKYYVSIMWWTLVFGAFFKKIVWSYLKLLRFTFLPSYFIP
jgi:hypothetical protein